MLVDLVQITAEDGLRLDGVLHRAPPGTPRQSRFDAVVCLHGTGSNFYSSSLYRQLTPRWLQLGISVLWANTRGHDGLSTAVTAQGRRQQGAAYERFSESPADVRGCVAWLVAQGQNRVGVIGHSAGAVKAIYAQAVQPHANVVGLIAISPPRLSYAHFVTSPKKREFLDTYRRAELLCSVGEGHTLMDVTFPLSYTISAAGYLEKYGPAEDYNVLKLLPRIGCPVLFTYGELEVEREVAFAELPQQIAGAMTPNQSVDVAVIAGADHVYSGQIAALGQVIEPWLLRSDVRKP